MLWAVGSHVALCFSKQCFKSSSSRLFLSWRASTFIASVHPGIEAIWHFDFLSFVHFSLCHQFILSLLTLFVAL